MVNNSGRGAVSVIIVSWNTRDLLEQCLLALYAEQGKRVNSAAAALEVIVVDNGSSDNSQALLREKFPQVKLIESGSNLGFGRANNLGAQRATGEFLFLLNPDTIVQPGALSALVQFLHQHSAAGLVAPRLLNPDGSLQRNAFRFPGLMQTFLDLFPLHPRLIESPLNGRYRQERNAETPFEINHPLGAAMLIRREVFAAVKGFDEGFFMYAEEVDLCMRIRRVGWQIWQEPNAVVTHFGGQSTGQVRAKMFVELWRARLRFYQLHYPRGFQIMARMIVRAGMLRKTLVTRLDEKRGRMSHEQSRELQRAYNKVFRL